MTTYAHADLCEMGHDWLRDEFQCELILIEPRAPRVPEIPDVIGWTPDGECLTIEAKVDTQDYLRDSRKHPRRCGNRRWYLSPRGVISYVDDHWGLLSVQEDGTIRQVVAPTRDAGNYHHEKLILIAAARKQSFELAKDDLRRLGSLASTPRYGSRLSNEVRQWFDAIARVVRDDGTCSIKYALTCAGIGPHPSAKAARKHVIQAAAARLIPNVCLDRSAAPYALRAVKQGAEV